jgi:hypothetical protein
MLIASTASIKSGKAWQLKPHAPRRPASCDGVPMIETEASARIV